MKKNQIGFIILILALCSCMNRSGKSDKSVNMSGPASKPPMGWNSFDAYDWSINEEEFRATVDYMANNLLEYGWNYAVIDYIWWRPNSDRWNNPVKRYGHPDIRYAHDGKPLDPVTIDEYGRLMPSVERFPSSAGGLGFKPLADYVHSKGMKFGIHLMRGIHRYAAYYNLPVKGSSYSAQDIADKTDTCKWCNHMYGVDSSRSGAREYYNSLFELYASWGVDFVKVDDMIAPVYHEGELDLIRSAIDSCGRPMVLSLSPGEAPVSKAGHLAAKSNMWRISADFWDEWEKLLHNFDLLEKWSAYTKPGGWPDADMLPVGRISLGGRPHGPERITNFTWPEQYTLMTLWMISRSPLMIGADLLTLPDSTLKLFTNPEAIAVNQNSTGNRQLFKNHDSAGWIAEDQVSGEKYLALFNLSDSLKELDFDLISASLSGKYQVRDIWKQQEKGIIENRLTATVEPHGAVLYRLKRQ